MWIVWTYFIVLLLCFIAVLYNWDEHQDEDELGIQLIFSVLWPILAVAGSILIFGRLCLKTVQYFKKLYKAHRRQ